jgi:hypothetical protein
MLILGRGKGSDGKVIDGNTVYILETLPGIKARALKKKGTDEARGLATVCLYFNLKLKYRDFLDTNQNLLRDIMGAKYQPRFSDFAYPISHGEFDFAESMELPLSEYGFAYAANWNDGLRYDEHGDISHENRVVVVKFLAESKTDALPDRLDIFCRKVSGPCPATWVSN